MMHQIVHFTRSILSAFKIWQRLLAVLTIVTILFWVVCSETALADSVIRSRESEASTLIPNSEFRIPNSSQSIQPYYKRVSQDLTEFRLSNGMKFIVLERHQAPVVSFLTYADVGGVNEPVGKTGVAHFL